MDSWYLTNLACPRDHLELLQQNGHLCCAKGHAYPIVEGVPVMLLDDATQTMDIIQASLDRANTRRIDERMPNLYLESLGINEEEKKGVIKLALEGQSMIDPVVAYIIAATNGYMYKHLIGNLASYPIPELRLPVGTGSFLDLGCNWGRWCIAAAQRGYRVVGIDPSLGAIMAAKRVSEALGLSIRYLVADARYLPFPSGSLDNVFSYSVLQHLSRENVASVLSEVGRVLKPGGTGLIQMPTPFGLRCMYHQAKRRFREARDFEVRYWSIPALKRAFTSTIGRTEISVDCYFGIGLQKADSRFMPLKLKFVLTASEALRAASSFVPALKYMADSVYVKAVKS
jgi:SAM-dependent methyltransferase/uncharacterized protein YbaR (Trm112 family)